MKVPNHLHKEIIDLFRQCKKNNDVEDLVKLMGKVNFARQIEPEIFPGIYEYIQSKKKAINRYYRKKNRKKGHCNNDKIVSQTK